MITGKLKSEIDKLWEAFRTGGITNPLTVIEQISFLMFARLLDVTESRNEKQAERTKKPFSRVFSGPNDIRRWKNFKLLPPTASDDDAKRGIKGMLPVVRDEEFPHFRKLNGGTTFAEYMADAQFMVQQPSLLVSAVNMIDALPLTEGDTKGDLYEYLLSKLTTAGINGQFRTPRHVIRFMVELLEPLPTDVIGDPACGTAGFLVGVMQYLLETYTSKAGVMLHEDGGKTYAGDKLEAHRKHIHGGMFHGYDFDATMLRIASMNLMLHGVDNPDIHYQDTLSSSFVEKTPEKATGFFDVILANPPFKGSLDEGEVDPTLTRMVKTRKTEILFLALILRMLRKGGRSATIVPEGVLFGASKAHVTVREKLVEENQLEAVISLPGGVFRPYAGVSTAIVVFRKGGVTDGVFFYDVGADGFSLDDNRTPSDEEDRSPCGPKRGNDLYDALTRWRKRDAKQDKDRTAKHFMVPVAEIRAKGFDLSINRYKETAHEEVKGDALEKLRPAAKPRMIDLVKQAGIDVGPWAFRADGKPVKSPAANPAYCYEWCFVDDDRVVLSLWFELMSLENGRVVQRVNMRDLRRRVERAKHLDAGTRTANVRRAAAVDSAVFRAFREALPVRAIVCDGDRRDLDDVARRDPSKVERRLLDDSPWHVTAYDLPSGDTVIARDQLLLVGARS